MDVRIEAAPLAADVVMVEAVIKTVVTIVRKVTSLVKRVASFSCLSLGGTSLSAISPDAYSFGRTTAARA